jgi:hypothetical protein
MGNYLKKSEHGKGTFENILASMYQSRNCQVPIHHQHFFRHVGHIKEKRQQSNDEVDKIRSNQ